MSHNQPGHGFDPVQAMKKLITSAVVIGSFVLYVAYDRHVNSGEVPLAVPTEVALLSDPSTTPTDMLSTATSMVPTPTTPPSPTITASVPPTNTPIAEVETQVTATDIIPTASPIPSTVTPVPPSDTPLPPTDVPTDLPPTPVGKYRNGLYKGDVADAFYGNVQVQIKITGGKIALVQFLDYPHDRRTSQFINSQAMPYLKAETIRAQSAAVDIISGATLTSQAFIESLQSALKRAKS